MYKPHAFDVTHLRLLHWLRHYPFQRLEDLVLALSPWSGRTTIYTHLKDLEEAQLIEAMMGPLCPGKRLYHLSPAGLTWVMANTPGDASPLSRDEMREARMAERTALLRLLPRVPVLLTLQTMVNGLVSGAAQALTWQGHRARLVRWNWQRDAVHQFMYQGQQMRWFADSVGAFCLRFLLADGRIQEQWYRFFLLYTPLTQVRLMRARLDRLLRWREARERWRSYTQMPPILILAESMRQAAWWQEAAEHVTQALGVVPPLGAITSRVHETPTLDERQASRRASNRLPVGTPWEFSWKRLGSQQVCHLRELVSPQNDPDFPDLFPREPLLLQEQHPCPLEREKIPLLSRGARLYRFERRREGGPRLPQKRTLGVEAWRWSSLDLSPRQWDILWLLQAHPLLSRENLCAHLHLEGSSVRHLLAPLAHAELIQEYGTRVGERFALAERGLRLLAASSHCHVRYLVHRPDSPGESEPSAQGLVPRGLPGLLKQVEHIAGVYSFFDALAGFGWVRWWETGAICVRFYRFQEAWYSIRPDAVAECAGGSQMSQRPWRFWLEWDRGTMHQRDLQRKLGSYARFFASRAWAREHPVPPTLLCVVPEMAQERSVTQIALSRLKDCPVHVALYVTTRSLLITAGISAAIWRQVLPHRRQGLEHFPDRLALFPTEGEINQHAQQEALT
jgi:hypothetical protein